MSVDVPHMDGIYGPKYSSIMVGLTQVAGVGTKIQRTFAPSAERHVVGTFGLLQKSSEQIFTTAWPGQLDTHIKGLMINIFA
jgi:hypothetical protein